MTTQKHKKKQLIEWRRSQVLQYISKGYTHQEISELLCVDPSVITRDVAYISEQIKGNIKHFVDEKIPSEFERIYIGLGLIIKEAWVLFLQTEDRREKLHALELVRSCYLSKTDLLTNARLVHDAVELINNHLIPLKNKGKEVRNNDNNNIKELEGKNDKNFIDANNNTVPIDNTSSTSTSAAAANTDTTQEDGKIQRKKYFNGLTNVTFKLHRLNT